MPDWAIVLVAAFGGGLAGAVLQPVVSYVLQRARSGEEIRKKRERSFRRMIEGEITWARKEIADLVEAPHPTEEQKLDMVQSDESDEGKAGWLLERIADPDLQQMIREHGKLMGALTTSLLRPSDGGKFAESAQQLKALQLRITLRMDDLNWPEADD